MQNSEQVPKLDYFVRRSRRRIKLGWNRKYNSTFMMGALACMFLLGAVILFRRSTFEVAAPPSPGIARTTTCYPAPAGTGGMTCVSYGVVLLGAFIGCGVKAVRLYFANTPHSATSAEASMFTSFPAPADSNP
jgi:hypothetical protein